MNSPVFAKPSQIRFCNRPGIRIYLSLFVVLFAGVSGAQTISAGQGVQVAPVPAGSQLSQGLVKNIVVKGNHIESTAGILAAMQTKVGQPFHQSIVDQDADTLYGLGVFQAKPLLTVQHNDDDSFTVTVEVVENPVIKEIRVVGNSAVSTTDILKTLTLKPGQIYSAREASISSTAIRNLYESRGFFAQISDLNYLPESPQTLDVQIEELKVGAITFPGHIRTKKRVFDHIIHTKVGDTYNATKWRDDITRLINTGWFDRSKFKPIFNPEPDAAKVDLGADLVESRTGNFGVGVQADPQSSIAGFVNLVESNFGGTGQSIGADISEGTAGGGASVDLSYGNPFIDSKNTSLNASIFSRVVYRFSGSLFGGSNLPTTASQYIERHTGGALSFARPLTDHTAASISTRYEGVKTSNLDTTIGDQFIQQDGTIAAAAFGYTVNRRDVDLDTSRGDYLSLTVEPGVSDITKVGGLFTGPAFLGSSTFVKYYGEYRAYFSPGPRRTIDDLSAPRKVLAFRIKGGTIKGKVPFFEQFFAGGADTVRGYQEDRFWGSTFLVTSLEYRYPIQKAFNLIPFVDYGGAWGGYGTVNNFYQTDHFRLHLGYGLGGSFRTPLGPIRIDLGVSEKGGVRTDFEIGTSF